MKNRFSVFRVRLRSAGYCGCAAVLGIGLAACGGSSSEADPAAIDGSQLTPPPIDAPSMVELGGQIMLPTAAEGVAAGTKVCADLDADLVCGADEPLAVIDAAGRFTLRLTTEAREAARALVAMLPAATTAPAMTLVAAPTDGALLDSLSTLAWLASSKAAEDAAGPPPAAALTPAAWARSLGLAVDGDEVAPDSEIAVAFQTMVAPALAATASGLQQTDAQETVLSALRRAGAALSAVLPRYVDQAAGTLLPTTTGRTLLAEATHGSGLSAGQCRLPPVASMQIDTESEAPIESKEVYLPATVSITEAGKAPVTYPTQIRGRGNSTWGMPKKPYRLKLTSAASLLGMAPERDWTLLANYADKTLLRNRLAFCLGEMLGLDYTPATRFVELTLNREYVGVYQLTDQIEVGAARVDIDEDILGPTDSDLGFLVEIDARLDGDEKFTTSAGVPIVVKSDIELDQVPLVADYFAGFEAALFGPDFADPQRGYRTWIDTSTLVDLYLINELLRNVDGFWSSTYLWRPRAGLMAFGPLWDFDLAVGNADYEDNDNPEGWRTRILTPYVPRLLDVDEDFRRHLAARWHYLHGRLADMIGFIDHGAVLLDAAQQRNFDRWPIMGVRVWPNPAHFVRDTYAGEIEQLQNWLGLRAAWMNDALRAELPAVPAE